MESETAFQRGPNQTSGRRPGPIRLGAAHFGCNKLAKRRISNSRLALEVENFSFNSTCCPLSSSHQPAGRSASWPAESMASEPATCSPAGSARLGSGRRPITGQNNGLEARVLLLLLFFLST